MTTATLDNYWRQRLAGDLVELRCAETMLKQYWMDQPEWGVVWNGKRAIESSIATSLRVMGGIAGEW